MKEIPKKKTKRAPKNPKKAINKAFIPLSENRALMSAFKPMAVIATVHKTSSKGLKIGVKIFATCGKKEKIKPPPKNAHKNQGT
jgi:hypothetical protein